jgi:hypothetical protein
MLVLTYSHYIAGTPTELFAGGFACVGTSGYKKRGQGNDKTQCSLVSTPAALVKEKQSAVTMLMDLRKDKSKELKAIKTTKPKATNKLKRISKVSLKIQTNKRNKTTALETKSKEQPKAALQDITNGQVKTTVTMHVGGYRHGDLNAMKCMKKVEALHYIRPNKFLEDTGCLGDCKKVVVDMQPAASNTQVVLNYCDQGINGYDAPDDDEMKAELIICNLVLCAQCKSVRRIAFDASSGWRRRRRG